MNVKSTMETVRKFVTTPSAALSVIAERDLPCNLMDSRVEVKHMRDLSKGRTRLIFVSRTRVSFCQDWKNTSYSWQVAIQEVHGK